MLNKFENKFVNWRYLNVPKGKFSAILSHIVNLYEIYCQVVTKDLLKLAKADEQTVQTSQNLSLKKKVRTTWFNYRCLLCVFVYPMKMIVTIEL